MKKRITLCVVIIAVAVAGLALAESSPWEKGSFISYINGDGSSLGQAVIIKVEGLSPCDDKECLRDSFRKISHQEYIYLAEQFGQMNVDWKLKTADNLEVDIEQNDKYYDVVRIILSNQDEKVLYFDITDPLLKLRGQ